MSTQAASNTTTENLISKAEAADRLGISIRTLEGLMKARALAFVRIAKRRIGFRPSEIERFIESRAVIARR